MISCIDCGKTINNKLSVYCSNKCQCNHKYKQYINDWKSGIVNGSRGINTKNMSGHIIRYILDKYKSKCTLCGWSEINLASGSSPLEIDHMDGNSNNNHENNLILLCPNCHSLTSNYKNLNKGHGRLWRREKYVKIDEVPT